jgi:SAM-dependent methyltransferase
MESLQKIKYFDRNIYFLNKDYIKVLDNDVWVNYTGLTTTRPYQIIDFLGKANIIYNNIKILDIGCGHAEMGIEIDRLYDVEYTGCDISETLLTVNKLNMSSEKHNFFLFDITDNNNNNYINNEIINRKFDVIFMTGLTNIFTYITDYINNKTLSKYIVIESHIGRGNDLDEVRKKLTNYKTIHKYTYVLSNTINPSSYVIANTRIMYVVELVE